MEQAAERRLSENLEVNEEYFRGRFAGTMDLMVRRVELGGRRAAPVSYTHLTLPTNREV